MHEWDRSIYRSNPSWKMCRKSDWREWTMPKSKSRWLKNCLNIPPSPLCFNFKIFKQYSTIWTLLLEREWAYHLTPVSGLPRSFTPHYECINWHPVLGGWLLRTNTWSNPTIKFWDPAKLNSGPKAMAAITPYSGSCLRSQQVSPLWHLCSLSSYLSVWDNVNLSQYTFVIKFPCISQ